MKRRALLCAGAGVAVAGCLGSGDGDSIRLAAIDVVNAETPRHTVDIEVLFDGDSVVDRRVTLDSGERDTIDDALPDDAGEYEITVDPRALRGETFVPGEQTGADCGSLTYELLTAEVFQRFEADC